MSEESHLDLAAVDEAGSASSFKGDPDDAIVAALANIALDRVDLRRRQAFV
jgi:hypothetical protein